MELNIGQKVSYPNQGVCCVEQIERKTIGDATIKFYALRVLNDNSTILVPTANAENIGVRPIISDKECKALIIELKKDFEAVSEDWKTRSKQFNEKLQSGDLFEVADVLKKLTFLSYEKKLSFREQSLLDKAKFLIVSEICNAKTNPASETKVDDQVTECIAKACTKHIDSNAEEEVAVVA